MKAEKGDRAYLWDLLDAAKAVQQFTASRTFHDYLKDRMLRSAVERQLEIMGEAARKISSAFREAHPEIHWQSIIARRHVLAHEYGEIKHELLWKVAIFRLPELIEKLEQLIPPLPPKIE